jgi:hypothetical protein
VTGEPTVPDPSARTISAVQDAVHTLSRLMELKVGGVEAVILQKFIAIDERLKEREHRYTAEVDEIRRSIALGISERNSKFDGLERRVAALELANSALSGRRGEMTSIVNTFFQALVTIAAVIGALIAYGAYRSGSGK